MNEFQFTFELLLNTENVIEEEENSITMFFKSFNIQSIYSACVFMLIQLEFMLN